MSLNIGRSPELEVDIVRKGVHRIREKDRTLQKRHDLAKYATFWDADDFRLKWKSVVISKTIFGRDVVIATDPAYQDSEGRLVIKPQDLVGLQFASQDSLKAIFSIKQEFGTSEFKDFQAEGLDDVRTYCTKMDAEILEVFVDMKKQTVKDVFGKFLREMGGHTIAQTDRLARRIQYLKTLTELYLKDKVTWKPELVRLKLLR